MAGSKGPTTVNPTCEASGMDARYEANLCSGPVCYGTPYQRAERNDGCAQTPVAGPDGWRWHNRSGWMTPEPSGTPIPPRDRERHASVGANYLLDAVFVKPVGWAEVRSWLFSEAT